MICFEHISFILQDIIISTGVYKTKPKKKFIVEPMTQTEFNIIVRMLYCTKVPHRTHTKKNSYLIYWITPSYHIPCHD